MDEYTVVDGRGAMTVFEVYIKTTPERLWEAITDLRAQRLRAPADDPDAPRRSEHARRRCGFTQPAGHDSSVAVAWLWLRLPGAIT